MRPFQTPFQTGWFSISLPHYREYPRQETYNYWPYQNLPALSSMRRWMSDQGQGTFNWLQEHGKIDARGSDFDDPNFYDAEQIASLNEWKEKVGTFKRRAEEAGIILPTAYQTFLNSPALLSRVRSCTDCYFNIPAYAVPAPHDVSCDNDAFLIRFLSDSQSCLHWYLYLTLQGEHCVLVSRALLGGMLLSPSELAEFGWTESDYSPFLHKGNEGERLTPDDFWYCGANFEAFLFRFWMENEIRYSLVHDVIPLTPPQQFYADECLRLNHDFNQSLLPSD